MLIGQHTLEKCSAGPECKADDNNGPALHESERSFTCRRLGGKKAGAHKMLQVCAESETSEGAEMSGFAARGDAKNFSTCHSDMSLFH